MTVFIPFNINLDKKNNRISIYFIYIFLMTHNYFFETKYSTYSDDITNNKGCNEQKQIILLKTLENLIKTNSYYCISCIISDLNTSCNPNLSNVFFLLEVLQVLMNNKNKILMTSFLNRNKQKIVDDKSCFKLIQIVYSLCYFSSAIDSRHYKFLQNNIYSTILIFLNQVILLNDLSLDIDLIIFYTIFTELAYLQACFLKISIIYQSFDKFIDNYRSDLKFDEEYSKIHLIEIMLISCNAGYEILYNIDVDKEKTYSTKDTSFYSTQSSKSSINKILTTSHCSEVDCMKNKEKYSINELDKYEFLNYIATCYMDFYSRQLNCINPIIEDNVTDSLSNKVKYLFNENFLHKKEYYIRKYLDGIENDNKLEIKQFYFTFHYEMLLTKAQYIMTIKQQNQEVQQDALFSNARKDMTYFS